MIAHEEFRELCALATSGCLTSEEESRLKTHLASCAECREATREYENVARIGVPTLALDFPAESPDVPLGWSEERAYQDFLERLENQSPGRETPSALQPSRFPSSTVIRTTRPWRATLNRLLPYAAAIAVALLTGLLGYRIGTRRTVDLAVGSQRPYEEIATAARARIAELSTERESLITKNQESEKEFSLLQAEMASRLSDIRRLQGEEQRLRSSLQESEVANNSVASERDALLRRLGQMQMDLEHSEADLALKQKDLEGLSEQRRGQTQREKELETRVAELEELLKGRDGAVERQQDLLAYDRDIRDLMGARDLYVAEVSDVGNNGKTKKPFGRVFFTKGKSLIFYAYDLDQQPGLHEANSFQAWGRRGPDATKSASLGIFYLDNSSHKRWLVKSDDPNLIEQLDAVFVTVEPKGGSQKPTGKQLLFAYLRVEPNHP